MHTHFVALALLAVVAQGAVAPQAPQPLAPTSTTTDLNYKLGSQDLIRVTVYDEAALSGQFRIDADGSISYPILGRVEVGGMTVREVEARLTELLQDGYVRRPQVSVGIEQYRSRSIFIMGEVRSPGKYPLAGEVTLLEVLALAGSFTPTASSEIIVLRPQDPARTETPAMPDDEAAAEILRVNRDDLQAGRLASNLILQDGDTIFVPVVERFYITGHVRTPGTYVLEKGMTVQQAIAVAGGLTERGSNRRIKVRRQIKGEFQELSIQLTDPVLPGDTIMIAQRLI
ncbi:MAG: polysaccharide biosynthesis/export family protein [Vicinamibacterales bacterium]|nr:polysaccharide biosynthesis/export family protein [Vicinamibacterales bacterium]